VERLRVNVQAHSEAFRIVPRGELDLETAPLLDEALARADRTPAPKVVLDLRQLSLIDSAGVMLLLRAAERSRAYSNRLRIIGTPGGPVERLLALCGLREMLPLALEP
jgi:anti-sigma B factor antagonist